MYASRPEAKSGQIASDACPQPLWLGLHGPVASAGRCLRRFLAIYSPFELHEWRWFGEGTPMYRALVFCELWLSDQVFYGQNAPKHATLACNGF